MILCNLISPGSNTLKEAFDGSHERRQVFGNGGLHNAVGSVEVSMREMITHPGNVHPRNARFFGEQGGIDRFHRFTDLDQPHPDSIENQAILEPTTAEVSGDGVRRRENVD
jgi:hypothetical protein